MNLGKRIDATLKELNKTQGWLCARVPGLTLPNLSALISRNSKSTEYAARIAKGLGVHALWLETGKGPQWAKEVEATLGILEETETALIQAYRQLTAEQKSQLLEGTQKLATQNRMMVAELAALYRTEKPDNC